VTIQGCGRRNRLWITQLDVGAEAELLGADELVVDADDPELCFSEPDVSDAFFSEPEDFSDPDDPVDEPESLATVLFEASRLSVR